MENGHGGAFVFFEATKFFSLGKAVSQSICEMLSEGDQVILILFLVFIVFV